jgi:glycerophosphoryl diester phosphodiesterase
MRLPLYATTTRPTTTQTASPRNIAHRGASDAAPENTLSAVRLAVAIGADLVEVDVQRSRDGALVVVHDTTLGRTTDVQRVFPGRGPWRMRDFSLDELRRLDAGSWKSSAFTGEKLPTLQEVLAVLDGSPTGLQLELKAPELYPGVVNDLVVELASSNTRVVVQSFHTAAMKDLKTRLPEQTVGLLGSPHADNLAALASWARQVNPHHWSVDRAYVDAVHRHGLECLVWTVDRPSAMRRALQLGVDGVITNRPERFAVVRTAGR